jgi:hypothetical protein
MTCCEFGTVSVHDSGAVQLYATRVMLWDWAHRSGAVWPCSVLAGLDEIRVDFDADGDLVDIVGDSDDLMSDELSAWSTDVLDGCGFGSHPAVRR